MRKRKRIAILFPVGLPHFSEVLRGLVDYAHTQANWSFIMSPEYANISAKSLHHWPIDGVIGDFSTQAILRNIKRINKPIINLSGAIHFAGLPRVTSDNYAIGRMVADHLLECGFRQFGYYGLRRVWYSIARRDGFVNRLGDKLGARVCSVLESPSGIVASPAWLTWMTSLEQWLKSLKRPFGVMAVDDMRAVMITDACGQLGLNVPDDVAVVGVNNDHLVCEFATPSISSVARNGYRIGYEAARLLGRLMGGDRIPEKEILISPLEIVQRRSSNVIAIDDPYVRAATQYIRDHITQPIGMKDVLSHVPVSRRWLEVRFRECLNMSPTKLILRLRIEKAKQLIIRSKPLSLTKISKACGFSERRVLIAGFKRMMGMTPAEYHSRAVSALNGTVKLEMQHLG